MLIGIVFSVGAGDSVAGLKSSERKNPSHEVVGKTLPNTFARPHPPTWRVDDDSTLNSNVYLWPGVGGGHVMHIRSADAPVTATWRVRASGHAQDAAGRWVLEGDAVLEARLEGPSGAVTGGEIRNMRIAPLDPWSL